MSNYDNTNRGAMWKNKNKQADTHPDLTGSFNIDGKEYWISGWKRKEGQSPTAPALSFSVKPKDDMPKQAPVTANASNDFEDDIPF